VVVVTP